MKLLKNVNINHASPQILLSMQVMDSVLDRYFGGRELTVTSCGDGKHGKGSKHYPGSFTGLVNAFDARIKDLDGNNMDISVADRSTATEIVAAMKVRLDAQFDIVLEKDHIHVEYDPK